MRERLEASYLGASEPWRQSGFSGPEERWIALRRPVADCIDRSGSFLDIGCANGYLVECVVRWTAERALTIDPFGIDLSPPLVALAQQRLPALASRFSVANGASFRPPRRFDFVRTELCCSPTSSRPAAPSSSATTPKPNPTSPPASSPAPTRRATSSLG